MRYKYEIRRTERNGEADTGNTGTDAHAPRIPFTPMEALAGVVSYTLFAIMHIFSHLGTAVGDEDDD